MTAQGKGGWTPGPWKAGPPAWFKGRRNPEDGKRPINGPPGTATIANAYGAENARLIAAAPTLAASAAELDRLSLVIESAVRFSDPMHHEEVLAALKANRAAILRARGEPKTGEPS